MRITLGVLAPDAGHVTWRGIETTALPRPTWGYLPEERGLYPQMTVIEQLVFFAGLHGVPARRRARARRGLAAPVPRPGLRGPAAEELSKGNQQKVQFLAAVLHDPQVLLMDEPFTGLDPVNVMLLREAFLELRDRGKTVVLSTHQMETAEALCESVAIVDRGRTVVGGSLRDVSGPPAGGWCASRSRRPPAAVAGSRAAARGSSGRASSGRRDRARARASSPRRSSRPALARRGPRHPLRGRRPVARAGLHRPRRAGRRTRTPASLPSTATPTAEPVPDAEDAA